MAEDKESGMSRSQSFDMKQASVWRRMNRDVLGYSVSSPTISESAEEWSTNDEYGETEDSSTAEAGRDSRSDERYGKQERQKAGKDEQVKKLSKKIPRVARSISNDSGIGKEIQHSPSFHSMILLKVSYL